MSVKEENQVVRIFSNIIAYPLSLYYFFENSQETVISNKDFKISFLREKTSPLFFYQMQAQAGRMKEVVEKVKSSRIGAVGASFEIS